MIPSQQPEVSVRLTVDEAQLIINALLELPAKLSYNLLGKVRAQVEEQLKPAEIKKDDVA